MLPFDRITSILNFSLNCRNHSHGVGYNASTVAAATQDNKVYMSEGEVRLPLNRDYRQNLFGNNAWTFSNYGTTRCVACDCHSRLSSSGENTFLCHGNHGEQCIDANTGLAGLALALTVHAVLEGLAIGLQTKISEVGT